MLSKELLKKIKLIQLHTDKLTNAVLAGEYESVFKGRGMEFSEVREYIPGDPVRSIDWNVTARMGHPFVKVYKEERELTIVLLVDLSYSGQFGSHDKFKNEVAAELSALFAYLAIKNNDTVGAILFTDRVEKYIPPKKGKSHIFEVIKEVLSFAPEHKKTNISVALEYLLHVVKKKSIAFLISDFQDTSFDLLLKLASKKHDLIAVKIRDARETEIPKVGLLELLDGETGETIVVDTSSQRFQERFNETITEQNKIFKELLNRSNVDNISIETNKNYVEPVIEFFRARVCRT